MSVEAPKASLMVMEGFLEEGTSGLIHEESPGGSQMGAEGSGFRDKICSLSDGGAEGRRHDEGGSQIPKERSFRKLHWHCAQPRFSTWNCPPNSGWEGAIFSPLKGQQTGSEPSAYLG